MTSCYSVFKQEAWRLDDGQIELLGRNLAFDFGSNRQEEAALCRKAAQPCICIMACRVVFPIWWSVEQARVADSTISKVAEGRIVMSPQSISPLPTHAEHQGDEFFAD